jgi:uncharacterized membrane protein
MPSVLQIIILHITLKWKLYNFPNPEIKTDYRYKVMNQKSIAIAAILAVTMLTAVFTTAPPFSLKSAEGQTIIQTPGRVTLPTSENRTEQNIVCSGWSYTCG